MARFYSALVFALFPIYSFLAWMLVFRNHSTQEDRVQAYKESIFNITDNLAYVSFFNIALSVAALYLISSYLQSPSSGLRRIASLLFGLLIGVVFYNIWGMM